MDELPDESSNEIWKALDTATANAAEEWIIGLSHNRSAPADVLIAVFDLLPGSGYRMSMLLRADLPGPVRDFAIGHPDRKTRILASETGNLTAEQWERLIASFDDGATRELVAEMREDHTRPASSRGFGVGYRPPGLEPPSTSAEIAEWAAEVPDVSPGEYSFCPWWIAALHHDADAMRQLAASANLQVRRGVARARHLPPDVLERLAHDEDRIVRLFLTESCDDTPAEVLLEVWSWWDGSFSFPGRPRNHPNFPKTGLLRYAEDADPRMRLLAVGDAAADAGLIDRLAADEDRRVRREALADPRVSPAVLAAALLDERFAGWAAKNPALPAAVMERMIGLARRARPPQ